MKKIVISRNVKLKLFNSVYVYILYLQQLFIIWNISLSMIVIYLFVIIILSNEQRRAKNPSRLIRPAQTIVMNRA